jgi:hypothetical protein
VAQTATNEYFNKNSVIEEEHPENPFTPENNNCQSKRM